MSRYDQEDVDFLNLPEPQTTAIYYTDGGKGIDREDYLKLTNPPPICAKKVQFHDDKSDTDVVKFYVLSNNRNQMFNPRETDSRYKIRGVWKFRKVVRSTFDLYIKFLETKYNSILTQAERGL